MSLLLLFRPFGSDGPPPPTPTPAPVVVAGGVKRRPFLRGKTLERQSLDDFLKENFRKDEARTFADEKPKNLKIVVKQIRDAAAEQKREAKRLRRENNARIIALMMMANDDT